MINNIEQLQEIVRAGSAVIRSNLLSSDRKLGFWATTTGLYVFDLKEGQLIGYYDIVVPEGADKVSISSNGHRFAITTDEKVEVWDLEKGKIFELILNEKKNYYDEPAIIKLSPDGKLLGVQQLEYPGPYRTESRITLYDLDTGAELENSPAFKGWDLYFSPSGTWFITFSSPRGSGVLYRVNGWKRVQDIVIRNNQGFKGISPDDKYLVIQDEGLIIIYQLDPWKIIRQISIEMPNAAYVGQIIFSPDSSKLGLSRYYDAIVWDVPTGEKLGDYPEIANLFTLANDGSVIPCFEDLDDIFRQMKIERDNDKRYLTNHEIIYQDDLNTIFSLRGFFDLDNKYESEVCKSIIGTEVNCQIFDKLTLMNNLGDIFTFERAENPDIYQVFSTNQAEIMSLGHIQSKADAVTPVWISSDVRFLLTRHFYRMGYVTNMELWDVASGTLLKRWSGSVTHFTVSENGNLLAMAIRKNCGTRDCGSELIVYDFDKHSVQFRKVFNNDNYFSDLVFRKNGDLFYSAIEEKDKKFFVQFYNFNLEKKTDDFKDISLDVGNIYSFGAFGFSPDETILLVGYPDGTVHAFDYQRKSEIYSWKAQYGPISDIYFSKDGTRLITSSTGSEGDGLIRIWSILP